MPERNYELESMSDEEIVADAQAYEKKGYDVYQLRSASAEAAKEIKDHEYRVGLTPYGVKSLCDAGHNILVESGAGKAIDLILLTGDAVILCLNQKP